MSIEATPDDRLRHDLLQVISGARVPVFHYQPIADLRTGTVAGYEALVRLPVHGKLPPDVCIAAAARFGIQTELEAVLVRQGLAARASLPSNAFLSINVSPAFLCSQPWHQLRFEHMGLAGVVVEITESECIEDYGLVRRRVDDILARGGMIAIDDAGAGYASLKHILELKPSFIKLDRALIQNCDVDRAKSTLIQVLGDAANHMDAWVITEGVETAQELAELIRLHVPLAQGYFLGRPQPVMQELTPEARKVIQNLAPQRLGGDSLLLYREICLTAATRAEAEATMHRGGNLAAVVDAWGRPMELFERHANLGIRALPSFLRCHTACNIREALQRALTREAPFRFDPILLTDHEGSLQGAVRVDRLMLAVLEEKTAQIP